LFSLPSAHSFWTRTAIGRPFDSLPRTHVHIYIISHNARHVDTFLWIVCCVVYSFYYHQECAACINLLSWTVRRRRGEMLLGCPMRTRVSPALGECAHATFFAAGHHHHPGVKD
jgi:hypothetical protein